ncbi:hypothetical protein D9Q98_010433 [Chlorella vulgaris]|uniref:O-fucosyltransferase family protein n=1 Tax=Chlorella vulgaris TaxID=3077 RepID=A0A9D4YYC5_CHLVU|nr:hypothetical protein D9Q98_010433 [Chlorella vulgaris]
MCEGFAHQRADILAGLVLAVELNRTLVLPRLLLDDGSSAASTDGFVELIDFGEIYDEQVFVKAMRARGVRIAVRRPLEHDVGPGRVVNFNSVQALAHFYASKQHLSVDCLAFRALADLFVKHEDLVFAALHALQPSQPLQIILGSAMEQLRSMSETGTYNVLHLKSGDEWLAHCSQWESIDDGIVRDNCSNNTARVGNQMRLHRVNRQVPLLVFFDATDTNSNSLRRQAIQNLREHNYKVISWNDVSGTNDVGTLSPLPPLPVKDTALINYHLALRCEQFVGNSVSFFSALLIMERWRTGNFAMYYNGGNIPMESFMPLYRMPWVFTYNDWSAGTEYDFMVKAAVVSAVEVARMKPYCMYSGNTSGDMYKWFVSKGVVIIQHAPAWRDALIKEAARNKEQNMAHSHLYKTGGTVVGTFQRIDIPILRQFDQYNYVLFTDCDVFFRKQMKLIDWGTPLPIAVGMGFEGQDMFPYNAGIMLMNMPYMRQTNQKFVTWILSQKNGLYYPGYGPLDQGALNQYYEKEIIGRPINKDFNAMMFHPFRASARIVHMNGPKPNHYLEWMEDENCAFGGLCLLGSSNGMCQYIAEYERFTTWDAPARLHDFCVSRQMLSLKNASGALARKQVKEQHAVMAKTQTK